MTSVLSDSWKPESSNISRNFSHPLRLYRCRVITVVNCSKWLHFCSSCSHTNYPEASLQDQSYRSRLLRHIFRVKKSKIASIKPATSHVYVFTKIFLRLYSYNNFRRIKKHIIITGFQQILLCCF